MKRAWLYNKAVAIIVATGFLFLSCAGLKPKPVSYTAEQCQAITKYTEAYWDEWCVTARHEDKIAKCRAYSIEEAQKSEEQCLAGLPMEIEVQTISTPSQQWTNFLLSAAGIAAGIALGLPCIFFTGGYSTVPTYRLSENPVLHK